MAIVKTFGANNNIAGTSIATASTAVGGTNTLVVWVSVDSTAGVPTITVSDGVNTFTQVGATQNDAVNNQCLAAFVAENVTAGTRVITASFASRAGRIISVLEFSGRASVSLDKGPGLVTVATGSTATDGDLSASVTTTTNGQDIAGCIVQTGAPVGAFSAGTGYTAGDTQSPGPVLFTESKTQTTAGAVSATFTDTQTGAYIAGVVTLKAAAAAYVSAIPTTLDKTVIENNRFVLLHSLISAQPGGYFPVNITGEVYPVLWVLAMAYAYLRTGITAYKTDAVNQFNYLATLADSNNVIISPDDTSVVFRDRLHRQIYYTAVAARLIRQAGDSSTAATMIASCELWGKAWFDKVNSGSPYANVQFHGWDANNDSSAVLGPPAWAASTLMAIGQRRRPTTANGHVYEPTTVGYTGTAEPTWPTTINATVTDGDVIWKEANSNIPWQASHAYASGEIVKPITSNSRTYRCIVAGTSNSSAPTWPTTDQATVTDGGVTWRCTSTTKNTSWATYTNNGTTYPAVGSADLDPNQIAEEAAAWSMLTTDPASTTFNAGTYKTKAETRITDVTSLLQTIQVSRGWISLGTPIPPSDGRTMYDSLYAAYSISAMVTLLKITPSLCHADTTRWLNYVLDWSDSTLSIEPLFAAHYSATGEVGPAEVEWRGGAYDLLQRTDPLDDWGYLGAFNFSRTGRHGYYIDSGPPEPLGNDAWEERVFVQRATAVAIGAFRLVPAAINATSNVSAVLAGARSVSGSVINASSDVTAGVLASGTGNRPIVPAAITASSDITVDIVLRATIAPAAINATSAVSAAIGRKRPVAATISASSSVTAAIQRLRPISGSVNASSNVTAAIGRLRPIVPSAINATSAVVAALSVRRAVVTGAINATSAVTAAIGRLRPVLPAAISASSTITAAVGRARPVLPAAVSASSSVTAAIQRLRPIAGAINATSAVTATVTKTAGGTTKQISGSVNATSTVSASVVRLRPIGASPSATSNITASLVARRAITASITSTSTVSASIVRQRRFNASIFSTSTVTAGLTRRVSVGNVAVASYSTVTAAILGTPPSPAVVAGSVLIADLQQGVVSASDLATVSVGVTDASSTTVAVTDMGSSSVGAQDASGTSVKISDLVP